MEDTLDIVEMCVMDDRSFILAYLIGAASMALWFEFRRLGSNPRCRMMKPSKNQAKQRLPREPFSFQ